jgi:WD40 repeat protein
MSVYGLDIVPGAQLAVAVSKDGTMRVWDLTRLTTVDQRARHDAAVDALAVSDDWVVSASRDRTLWLWDLKTGAPVRRWQAHEGTQPHEGWITTVALDAANGLIHSGGQDSTLRSWKLADGGALKVVRGDWQSGANLALTANGSEMLVTDSEYTQTPLAVWKPSNLKKAGIFKPKIFGGGALGVSADGRWVLVADFDETVTFGDVKKLRSVWKLKIPGSERNGVVSIAISPDATTALLGHRRGRLQSRRLKDRRLNWSFEAHSDQTTAVSISPDGQLCCSAGWDRVLRVWKLKDRSPVASFTSDDFWSACQFAPDSRTIVAADERGCLHFLRLEGDVT